MEECHDNSTPEKFEPFSTDTLRDDIYIRLAGYDRNQDARAAVVLLDKIAMADQRIGFERCITHVREGLAEIIDDETSTTRRQFCSQVQNSYPAGSDNSPELMSPKRFIKEHVLDGRIRPELREAQAQAISASRNTLVAAITADKSPVLLDTAISDQELEDNIEEEAVSILKTLQKHTNAIKELIPVIDRPIGRLGALALSALQYPNVGGVVSVLIPAEGKERAMLDSAIFGLLSTLKILLDGETIIAKKLIKRYEEQVRNQVSCALISQFEQLELESLDGLPMAVELAYASAAKLGPKYVPRSKPSLPDTPAASQTTEVKHETAETKQVTSLGEIASPFPWAGDGNTSVSLVTSGDKSLLFCDGMTAAARTISTQLRVQTENKDDFDRYWEIIKEIEMHGVGVTHSNVNRVKDLNAPAFEDVSVLYYGTPGPNARRTYYVKVPANKYTDIAEMAVKAGVNPESSLVILVAETDKANQLKTFLDFGISRRQGTQYGGGSI